MALPKLTRKLSQATMSSAPKRRVGIVGFGHLGEYLYKAITETPEVAEKLEIAFVWNRTPQRMEGVVPEALICTNLDEFAKFRADIIAEVCHPDISKTHGVAFASVADYFVGSPTAFADASVEVQLRNVASAENGFGVYIPGGALWGASDIQKMADRGTLRGLSVTMKKHPASMKVVGPLKDVLDEAPTEGETVLFNGSVRELCPLAPNNVNTMAAAAIAGYTLGFDATRARLVSDPSLEAHIIDIEVEGPDGFKVLTQRINPAAPGAVTGNQTYASFLSSLLGAKGRGNGVHIC